jgi:hypothetical protein
MQKIEYLAGLLGAQAHGLGVGEGETFGPGPVQQIQQAPGPGIRQVQQYGASWVQAQLKRGRVTPDARQSGQKRGSRQRSTAHDMTGCHELSAQWIGYPQACRRECRVIHRLCQVIHSCG